MPGAPASDKTEIVVDECRIELESGVIARQADGAVLVRAGGDVVLVTVVMAKTASAVDFLPLTVEYREKFASAGVIPGGYQKREGRISEHEILASRILDRSIRPLFPKQFHHEVQVQAMVLSNDANTDEGPLLALLGASAALHLSPVPWGGPMAGARLVRVDGSWSAFPSRDQRDRATAEFVVAGGRDGLIMLEGSADELPEDQVMAGLLRALDQITAVTEVLDRWREKSGRAKYQPPPPAEPGELVQIRNWVQARSDRFHDALAVAGKQEREPALAAVRETLASEFSASHPDLKWDEQDFHGVCRDLEADVVRRSVVEHGKRVDGRSLAEIRPIWCQIDWLPSPHGSAMFTRGETQALVSCTLASRKSEQTVDTLHGTERNRFLLHYNFPPFSVGEIRPLRGPGRREIGHGNLARRALLPVLPESEEFPYVIRIESDITESNGSSSMATTCGACLALMDAGVPVQRMVAGIAMGLIHESGEFAILSDILGDEDHLGDMDFKVTGTEHGITAVQMDNKIGALPKDVLRRALDQAREGRLQILQQMAQTIAGPRTRPKAHAPQVSVVRVVPAALPELIGPRGANIKAIEADCEAEISLDQPGLAFVYAANEQNAEEAVRRIRDLAGVVRAGRNYRGTVTGVKDFGAFVRVYQSAEGLVPVELWDKNRVASMTQAVREGDEVVVHVLGVDDRGRLRLSRKDALESGLEAE